jgi:arylsulfatase A-like enzyme
MNMMRKFVSYLVLGTALCAGIACHDRSTGSELPATFIWGKDQHLIDPASGRMNIWGGFELKDGYFLANKNIARFILWRKKGPSVRINIRYALQGSPCTFLVNEIEMGSLPPALRSTDAGFDVQLNEGFNFLQFDKTINDVLKIASINIQQSGDAQIPRRLQQGETLAFFVDKGAGRIEFHGKGRLKITEVHFQDGSPSSRASEPKAGFLSGRTRHAFSFDGAGYLTAAVESGGYDVTGYSFSPRAVERPPTAKVALPKKPGIFIFLIDACQARHLGLYGYSRPTSPNIDRFAQDAVVFENAYANASFTRASVATLFTGLYPETHKVRILKQKLPRELLTLPEYLKGKGYRTSIFTSTANVSRSMGFARGVDDYNNFIGEWRRGSERGIPSAFRSWLSHHGPLFSYVHYMEPHLPISPPPPYRDMFANPGDGASAQRVIEDSQQLDRVKNPLTPREVKTVVDNYDSAIAFVDGEMGKLLESLREKGLYENSLIVILSDHGESLYEHEQWGHGFLVYEETAHVPLVVKFPAAMNLKGRVRTVVELADVFPTVLDIFGQRIPLDGKSLLDAATMEQENDNIAVCCSFNTRADFGLRWRQWYAIINLGTRGETLYHAADPFFQKIREPEESVRTFLKARFLEWLKRFSEIDERPVRIDLNSLPKNEIENLRSLGYLK